MIRLCERIYTIVWVEFRLREEIMGGIFGGFVRYFVIHFNLSILLTSFNNINYDILKYELLSTGGGG